MLLKYVSKHPLYRWLVQHALGVVLGSAVLSKCLVAICYTGVTYFNDSTNYIDLAGLFLEGNFQGYDGARTPGYPLFLALFNNQHELVVVLQNIMGCVVVWMIFKMAESLLNRSWALLIGLALCCYLPFVFYDFAILTESLSSFLLVLMVFLIWKFKILKTEVSFWKMFSLSLLMALLFLVRPFFIYLPFLVGLFPFLKLVRTKRWIQLPKLATLVLVPLFAVYGWNSINQANTGKFMTTWYFGYNLTQMTTSFFEEIPEEDAVIREILLENRAQAINSQNPDDYPMTVWYAREELKTATGLNDLQLSEKLNEIAKELIWQNKKEYLQQVANSFVLFYGARSTLLWNVEKFEIQPVRKAFVGLWIYLQQFALIGLNVLFLLLSVWTWSRRKDWSLLPIFCYLLVVTGSILQALVAFGNNSRFCYPYTSLMLLLVAYGLYVRLQKTEAI